jgi:hypothetical protein
MQPTAERCSAWGGGGNVVVTADDVGDSWYAHTLLVDGGFAFVNGPGTPPRGTGSLQLRGPNLSNDKITFTTDLHDGARIADLQALTYWTYRDGSSTSPGHTVPSINIFITNGGPNGDVAWAPLVWEPIYPFGAGAIQNNTWQEWDTMAPSQTSYGGGWWSTRALGSICAFNCFVSWQTVLEQNPHATIIAVPVGPGSLGVNLGRGPSGSFFGNVDALSVTFDGTTTTYDFEAELPPPPPPANPTTREQCMNGGWQQYGFRNQGQCIRFINTGKDTRIGE